MYKEITTCRCCGNSNLFEYLDLGMQPLANSYHKGEKLDCFPLKVNLCEKCFHSQLSIVVDPPLMFKNYLYVSGTTYTFAKHCRELAKDAIKRSGLHKPTVLDVACNDGTLLEHFRDLSCDIMGIDPAENLRKITKKKDIPVEVAYWGEGASKLLDKKFDIITATNVFAHVDNISSFLDECVEVLVDNGTIIVEFPYCEEMISKLEFDTIYHEHLSYFLISSFTALIERKNLCIHDIITTPIHGGSIRFFVKRTSTALVSAKDYKKHIYSKDAYVNFKNQVEKNKADMLQLLDDLRSKDKKVIGYGASAKGNTMLNYFEIDLDYIVDDNSMKWGYMTPGRNIPIVSPQEIAKENEVYIVILSWNFYDEIIQKIEKIAGKSHHYIRYVPEISCV